ncbi:class I SAM-dependent methyltransferase [Uliginosibacterium sp. H1]|uniref:class I SAM-dependent methyltransferase n=1 Tax=Uliginosibacterium sp. H1 TaxID=3114757 RepID=UPI002E18FD2E|nr:class I SAM-dependent methyltransferase [Uliginosibacterium sp. H1]
MDQQQLNSLFDQQAATYDQQWVKLAAFRDSLHLLLESVFRPLPVDANLLCVGVGTGAEMARLAALFPGWRFTAVEPSRGMLDECRRRMEALGLAARCTFHAGYVDELPDVASFDAATCFLVSQFILDDAARTGFFHGIARRLRPGAMLASSDLSADTASPSYPGLLDVWMRTMAAGDLPPERVVQMREAYARDVGIRPPATVEAIIMAAGFDTPVQFYQAGMIRGWYAQRTSHQLASPQCTLQYAPA